MKTTTAGKSRKSHKSLKTTPSEPVNPESSVASAGSPSSTELTTTTPPVLSKNPLQEALTNPPNAGVSVQEGATPIPQEDPKQQWWYRTPDSKARPKFDKVMVMRAAGRDDKFIAKKLGTTVGTIYQIVYLGRRNGWCDDNDEPIDLEADMALTVDRKVVRNINASLDGQMTNWQTHEMTLELMKRRKVVNNVEEGAQSQQLPIVAIQVIMPPVGERDQHVAEGSIGGTPAYVDGESIDGELEAGDTVPGPADSVDTQQ